MLHPPTPGCSPPLPSGPHIWLPMGGCLLPPCRFAAMAMATATSSRVPVELSVRKHAGAARGELACVRSRSPAPTPKPWAVPTAPSLRGWAERFPARLVSGCAPAACSQRASDRAPPRAPRSWRRSGKSCGWGPCGEEWRAGMFACGEKKNGFWAETSPTFNFYGSPPPPTSLDLDRWVQREG